jgi:hypothetical protein
VNPHGSIEDFPAEHAGCADDCHLPGNLDLAPGELTLTLPLSSPDGETLATAERSIIVDRSAYATIPIDIVLQSGEDPVPAGITVRGATWLYMWRARHALAQSSAGGHTELSVEALGQAPTEYLIEVEPTIVDGVRYVGLDSRRVILAPGAQHTDPVTLTVTGSRGQVEGRIIPPAGAPSIVRAVCLEDGHSLQAPVGHDGSFHFEDIPLDRYRLALNNVELASGGYMQEMPSPTVDLIASDRQDVTVPLRSVSGPLFSGLVRDEEGRSLPFAWLTDGDGNRSYPALPSSGEILWAGAPPERTPVVFQAPGYYSHAALLEPATTDSEDSFVLTPHPRTQTLSWGTGSIILPDDSETAREGRTVTLQRGWLWGSGAAQTPWTIQVGPHTLRIDAGRFALEFLPPRRGWLYLIQGEASLQDGNNGERLDLSSGQMVNLLNDRGLEGVAYDPVVVAALQEIGAAPLPQTWEPSMAARFRDGLARTGVGLAQIITFVTYILVCFSILSIPAYGLYLKAKGRRVQT